MGILGFDIETSPAGGRDFTPIVKFDARSGRIFRIERVNTGNGFANEPVDITAIFKAIIDFDHMYVGWINFPLGSAPAMVLVNWLDVMNEKIAYPRKPSEDYKNGARWVMKLSKNCGGERPVREMAGNSKAFLAGVEALCTEYAAQRARYPGQLPVVSMAEALPVKTGSGQTSSTNYRPRFVIDGWAPRPADLVHIPIVPAGLPVEPLPKVAPSTGSTPIPPNTMRMQQTADDDFG